MQSMDQYFPFLVISYLKDVKGYVTPVVKYFLLYLRYLSDYFLKQFRSRDLK